jgi:drug/metabolite transporter (DMT)-like permease
VTEAPRSRTIPLWLAYCLAAVVIFGLWGIFSTAASRRLSPWQVQVFSTLGMLPVAAVAASRKTFLAGSNLPRGIFWAFCTGIANAAGNVALFAALNLGAEASVIFPLTAMYPVVTIFAARLILNERLTLEQWAGVGLTLIAILLFSLVESDADSAAGAVSPARKAAWFALAGVCLLGFGLSGVSQKVATRYISDHMSIAAFIAANVPISIGIAAIQPMEWEVGWTAWLLSLAIGLSIGVSTLLLFASFSAGGKAGIVTAMGALYPGITVLLAVPLFGERITPMKGLGIVVALAAGVLLSRERSEVPPKSAPVEDEARTPEEAPPGLPCRP